MFSVKSKVVYDIPASENIPGLNKDPKFPSIVAVDGDLLPPKRKDFDRNLIPKLDRFFGADNSPILSSKKPAGIKWVEIAANNTTKNKMMKASGISRAVCNFILLYF